MTVGFWLLQYFSITMGKLYFLPLPKIDEAIMQKEQHFTDKLADEIQRDDSLDDTTKIQVMRNLAKMKETKINILIMGATGCGKIFNH